MVYRHALGNALIPVLTVVGLQFGSLLAGAIVTETVFSWPGIGRLTLSAISNRDYALVQGCILAVGLTYVAVNLLTDVAYTLRQPAHEGMKHLQKIRFSNGSCFHEGLALLACVASRSDCPRCHYAALRADHTATASPAQRSFHDPTYKISFDYPANWNFARRDHEISTFRLDARTAARTTLMRAVVSMPENPFPDSTFSGAYLYFSVTPHRNDAACARQAAPAVQGRRGGVSEIAGISFAHGHDEQTGDLHGAARRGVYHAAARRVLPLRPGHQ